MKREEVLGLLTFIGTFFGRKRRERFIGAIADAATAYDEVRETRQAIEAAAFSRSPITLDAPQVQTLDRALVPIDELFKRLKRGDF